MSTNTDNIIPTTTAGDSTLLPVELPTEIQQALLKILEYLWADEYRSYQVTPRAQREHHICRHLHRLRVWLRYPEAYRR